MNTRPGSRRWLLPALTALFTMIGLVATPAAQATGTTTGFLEICKTASGAGVTGTFQFTVSGVATPVSVPVGGCSQPIQVAAGQVTVTESERAGFAVAGITAAPADRLVSSDLGARRATVKIVAGDVGTQTIVTFSNKAVPKGFLEVCKKAADGDSLTGSFTFTVVASGTTRTVTVPVGGCSTAFEVPAGQATITEAARDGTELTAIAVTPADRLVSSSVPNRTVTVRVVAGGVATQTIVTFTNKTKPPPKGIVKVCKKAGPGVAAGQEFSFTVGTVQTTAKAGSCSLPIEVAAGQVTVTEAAVDGIRVSAITVLPAGALVSSNLENRTATVRVTGGQVTEVTFTNEKKTGTLKVCKIAGRGVEVGQQFTFTVGAQTVTVAAGSCSLPITLPVGDVTVKETVPAGFEVSAIAVVGAGSLVSSDLATATAVVRVAVGVTEVNFTNRKKTGTLKVCKIAGRGVEVGQQFTFTVGGQTVTVAAGSCSLPITLPVGDVTVKETVPAGFEVTVIAVVGAGSLVSSDLATATAVVRVAVGVTEVNFTNRKKPPPVHGCVNTKGFYKNHPDVVARLVTANGGKLRIGDVDLTAANIDEIYGRNASNFLNQVSQQLITARLNQLSGASTPAAVQTAIDAAQKLVKEAGGPLDGEARPQTTVEYNGVTYRASQLVDILSSYNEGTAAGGPPHCG